MQTTLECICGATAKDTSKERGRFYRRHPINAAVGHIEAAQIRDKIANLRIKVRTVTAAEADRINETIRSHQATLHGIVEVGRGMHIK